jgi:metal-dependent hydrolase (beta-lactamase superfamily II)
MKNYKLTFLNHASFSIETDDFITLVDPWYFNRIFNNSWCLLRDTDDSKIDYSKLKYISVSHEHPDHLHWPTLKYIKTKTDNEITIIFPRRTNPNVMDECKKSFHCFYEEKDAIGKRYRRQDAIGTPFCVTIDHQTKEDGTVTVRHRDSMTQERIPMDKVKSMVLEAIS